MRRGRSTQVSVFDPESSGNRFSAEFKLTGDGGSPYEFGSVSMGITSRWAV